MEYLTAVKVNRLHLHAPTWIISQLKLNHRDLKHTEWMKNTEFKKYRIYLYKIQTHTNEDIFNMELINLPFWQLSLAQTSFPGRMFYSEY